MMNKLKRPFFIFAFLMILNVIYAPLTNAACTPNWPRCLPDGKTVEVCKSDGNSTYTIDCTNGGLDPTFTCVTEIDSSTGQPYGRCKASGPPPPSSCGGTGNCYNDCIACGGGTGECRAQCGSGGGSSSGSGAPMIKLNQIIDNALVPLGFKFSSSSTLGTIFTGILPILYGLAGFGLLIYLVLGGLKYLTSQGDPKKVEAAKNSLTVAVIGFVIIIVAYWLTQIVNYVFHLGSGF